MFNIKATDLPLIKLHGLTVRELYSWLTEFIERNGAAGEVWVGTTDGRSNQAVELWRLNGNDMIIEPPQRN